MPKGVTSLNIKNENGSFTNVPIAVKAENVKLNNGKNLEDSVAYLDTEKIDSGIEAPVKTPLYQEDIVDHLNSSSSITPLSAAQGKVLQNEIDTLKTAGSTPSDTLSSEIIDIRNGADGKVYKSAGTAVRSQLGAKEDKSNKVTGKNPITGELLIAGRNEKYPTINFLQQFYYDNSQVDELIEQAKKQIGTADWTELKDLRTGADGKQYDSAGLAVRTNIQKVSDKVDDLLISKADKATTLAGYGIEDAYTKEETAINFIKNISGAVEEVNLSSKLLSKLSYVTPQMFKDPDDIDDTEAIQRAIDTGKSVYIPRGVYKVRKIVIAGYNGRIYGDGIDNTIIKHNDTYTVDDCIIHITENSNCTLSSMSVVGGSYIIKENGSYSGKNYHGIMVNKCNSGDKGSLNIIDNVDVCKCLGSGIYLAGTDLGACNGCRISNVHTYYNVEYGLYNAGFGNKVVNLDTHQNHLDGLKINAGGFNVTNIKSWGNWRDGINIDSVHNKILAVVLSNVSPQQNGRYGLIMGNCNSCVITGLQSLANNYISPKRLADGTQLYANTAGLILGEGNHNNYIQGNITSGYENWNSIEDSSVRIAGADNTNNVIDLSVCDSMIGADMYNTAFNPINYTDSKGTTHKLYNYTQLPEYRVIRQRYDNPLNSIRINGKAINDTSMTNLVRNSSVTNSYMKKTDGTNYITMADNLSDTTSDILTLSLSDYTELPKYTIDALKALEDIDVAKVAYRRGYSLVLKDFTNDVMYIKFTAKVSEYKAFGIFPIVQVMYKNESGATKYEYLDISLDYAKTNVIFGTDYITKYIALDISKYKAMRNITVLPRLCITKLSDDIQDTATIDIKEFSYKLC